jgi:hypothetical protein
METQCDRDNEPGKARAGAEIDGSSHLRRHEGKKLQRVLDMPPPKLRNIPATYESYGIVPPLHEIDEGLDTRAQ